MGKTHWDHDPERALNLGYRAEADGTTTVVYQSSGEDIRFMQKTNRSLYNFNERPTGKEWHQIGSIDPHVYYYWLNEMGIDILLPENMDAALRLLHDPDWRDTRVAPGEFRSRPTREYTKASTASVASLIGKPREPVI